MQLQINGWSVGLFRSTHGCSLSKSCSAYAFIRHPSHTHTHITRADNAIDLHLIIPRLKTIRIALNALRPSGRVRCAAQVQISKSCTQLIANKRITQINHHHSEAVPYNSNLRVIRIKRPRQLAARKPTLAQSTPLDVCACARAFARGRTQMQMSALKFCPRFAAQRARERHSRA